MKWIIRKCGFDPNDKEDLWLFIEQGIFFTLIPLMAITALIIFLLKN